MNTKNLILVALLVAAAASVDFSFDFRNSKVESFDAWDEITFPCAGGSNDYDYSFDRLPKNWFASRGKVYAPKGEIESNNNFGIRVSVYDRGFKQHLKRSILFSFKNRSFKNIFDTDYDFDLENKYSVDDYIFRREKGDIISPQPQPKPEINIRPSYQFPSEK